MNTGIEKDDINSNKILNSFPNEDDFLKNYHNQIKAKINSISKFFPYYKKVINSFFKKDNGYVNIKSNNPFDIKKIEKCRNIDELIDLLQSTTNFLNFLILFDLTWIEKIKDDIIREPGEKFIWNVNVFNNLSDINSAISFSLYKYLYRFEKYIKNGVLKFILLSDFELTKFKKDEQYSHSSELNNFLKINHDVWKEKWKYNSLFNVLTFGDFIDLIKSINSDVILSKMFQNLFGTAKYTILKIKNNDDYNLKEIFIKNLETIGDLRNAIMHFSWIMPNGKENLLADSIKAFNFFSQQMIGNEPQLGDAIYREIISIVTRYNTQIDHPILYQYFSDFFYKYDLYKFVA